MSEFVDYTKRSVTLPDGCKDLADVLNVGDASVHTYWTGAQNRPFTHHQEDATLDDVLNCVTEQFASEAEEFALLVEGAGLPLFTLRVTGDYMFVATWVANDRETVRRLYEFSDRCVVRLREIPANSLEAAARSTQYVLSLLPAKEALIRHVTAELFESVHRRTSGLSMHW